MLTEPAAGCGGPRYGTLGLYADKGHTFLGLADSEGNNVIYQGKHPASGASGNQDTQHLQWILGKTARGESVNEWTKPHLGNTAKLVAKWGYRGHGYRGTRDLIRRNVL